MSPSTVRSLIGQCCWHCWSDNTLGTPRPLPPTARILLSGRRRQNFTLNFRLASCLKKISTGEVVKHETYLGDDPNIILS